MSKQWYYEAMGSPVGPITTAELRTCVLTRRILPETRIKLGDDGKWQTADRVKGLFDGAQPPAKPQAAAEEKILVAPVVRSTTAAETGTAELATLQTAELKIQVASVTPAVAAAQSVKAEDDSDVEYDFFKFVGFEIAIGHSLNDVLREYCRVHHVTMTQTTRRALAEFLGRKDLSGDGVAATATPPPEVFGVG
jgi:hypothetical protein